MRKLTIDDIQDLRAYERERPELRREIIAMKKRRRIALGDLASVVFENTETMRWQIQEMARAERMLRDEQIQQEVDVYNELIPGPGELSATLFIELDTEEKLREWLPKLVGIHSALALVLADGSTVAGAADDEERLTRDDVTPAVHFLKFRFTPEQVETFRSGAVRLVVHHPDYTVDVTLPETTHAELTADLTP